MRCSLDGTGMDQRADSRMELVWIVEGCWGGAGFNQESRGWGGAGVEQSGVAGAQQVLIRAGVEQVWIKDQGGGGCVEDVWIKWLMERFWIKKKKQKIIFFIQIKSICYYNVYIHKLKQLL